MVKKHDQILCLLSIYKKLRLYIYIFFLFLQTRAVWLSGHDDHVHVQLNGRWFESPKGLCSFFLHLKKISQCVEFAYLLRI